MEIGCHYKYGIPEINCPSIAVRKPSVIHYLEKHIEYIRMSLFYFIQQDNRIGLSPDLLSKLPALLITYITGRRSCKPRYAEFFHILRHVKPYDSPPVAKQIFRQNTGKFCLADTCGTKEEE